MEQRETKVFVIKLSTMEIAIVNLRIFPDENHYTMIRIHVPKDFRNKGYGSKLLREALTWADENNITIRLLSSSSGNMSDEALDQWYFKHGFEKYEKEEDEDEDQTLVRFPR